MKHESVTVSVEKSFRRINGEWGDGDDSLGTELFDSLPFDVFVATVEYSVSVVVHPGDRTDPPDVVRTIDSAHVESSVRLTKDQERFLIERYQFLADADW